MGMTTAKIKVVFKLLLTNHFEKLMKLSNFPGIHKYTIFAYSFWEVH